MAFANKIGGLIKNAINSTPSIYQSIRCMSSAKLFVGGISWSTDDNSLKDAFGSFGDVVEARVIVDRETGRSRGFGFVTFASTEEASNALSAMDQKELHGRVIRVNYANDRSRGGGGFGGGGYGAGYGGGGYGGGGYGGGGGGYGGGGGSYSGGGGYDGGSGGGGSYSGGGGYDGGSGGSMYSGGGGGVGDGSSYGGSSGVSSFGSSGSGAYAGNDSYGSGSSAGARGSFDKDDGLDLIKDDAYEPDDDYANKREN